MPDGSDAQHKTRTTNRDLWEEVRAVKKDVSQIGETIERIENKLDNLIDRGNAQDIKMALIEQEVKELKTLRQKFNAGAIGLITALGLAVASLIQAMFK